MSSQVMYNEPVRISERQAADLMNKRNCTCRPDHFNDRGKHTMKGCACPVHKPSQYGGQNAIHRSKPTRIDGMWFASQAEGKRYLELRRQAAFGDISDLECHPRYNLRIKDTEGKERHLCRFTPDFQYKDKAGKLVVEDVKGWKKNKRGEYVPRLTREFHMKQKLMLYLLGIEVKVV